MPLPGPDLALLAEQGFSKVLLLRFSQLLRPRRKQLLSGLTWALPVCGETETKAAPFFSAAPLGLLQASWGVPLAAPLPLGHSWGLRQRCYGLHVFLCPLVSAQLSTARR